MKIEERISERLGISTLLPMQRQMMDIKLPARILLCAPTGSGKTLAFAIAVLRTLRKGEGVKALIVAPTRELVLQIFDTVRTLAAPEFKTAAVYGGHSFAAEAASLEGMPDIVVGTPGRILDHLHRRRLFLESTRTLVIDEYDKALELGFAEEMRNIVGRMKSASTVMLTSATNGDIPAFVGAMEQVLDYSTEGTAAEASVAVYRVESPVPDKLATLAELLRSLADRRTIVFVNHRDAAERVATALRREGFEVALYHGGMEQDMRERALILFRNGTCPVMVATDLAARGLDIEGVDAVVHYHMPTSDEAWTHRNGRTARMGRSGSVYAIVSESDTVPACVGTAELFEPSASQAPNKAPAMATLFFNAGRRDKISRGDIVGFLIQKGGLTAQDIGRIDVGDRCAYAAVTADKARAAAIAVAPYKIKNTRVRVTQLKNLF